MFKKELKLNCKSFIIWSAIISFMLITVYFVYPTISSEFGAMKELLETMPEGLLKSFNMDLVDFSKVSGWLLSEGFILICLLGGMFASILASSIITKEENDKTIEFLYSLPLSKNKIITSKLLVGIFYIIILNILIMLINYIGLIINNDFSLKVFLSLFLGSLLIHLLFFSITLFISTFFKSTKKTIGISIALVLGTYILKILGDLTKELSFLHYFSPYELLSARDIIEQNFFEPLGLIMVIIFIILGIIGIFYNYNKKEYV